MTEETRGVTDETPGPGPSGAADTPGTETPGADAPGEPPVHPKHRARDKFGKDALQAAHEITRALADAGVDDDGVVVLRTDGPRPGLADLERLIDEALEEDGAEEAEEPVEDDGPGRQGPAPGGSDPR